MAAVVQAVHLGDGPAPTAQLSSGATGVFSDPASGRLQEFVTLLRLSGRAAPPAACFAEQPAAAAGEPAAAAGEPGAAAPASSSLVQATDKLLQNVGEDPGRRVSFAVGFRCVALALASSTSGGPSPSHSCACHYPARTLPLRAGCSFAIECLLCMKPDHPNRSSACRA